MSALPYVLTGLLVLIGTMALYFAGGGAMPRGLDEWASFGSYVGGIAGPLLSFIALIAVVRTLHLQGATLELEQARQLADKHLRWLDALYSGSTGRTGVTGHSASRDS